MKTLTKNEFNIVDKIVDRAFHMNLWISNRLTAFMDISNAHKQFGLKLEEFLTADDENFAHDFCGIQNHINRLTGRIEDLFLPRFAKEENT